MNKGLLEKFKKLYFEKFGISLGNEEATEMATELINLMAVLLKPDKPSTQVTPTQERREYATVSTQ